MADNRGASAIAATPLQSSMMLATRARSRKEATCRGAREEWEEWTAGTETAPVELGGSVASRPRRCRTAARRRLGRSLRRGVRETRLSME
jgi:hypothetical protein